MIEYQLARLGNPKALQLERLAHYQFKIAQASSCRGRSEGSRNRTSICWDKDVVDSRCGSMQSVRSRAAATKPGGKQRQTLART